MATLGHSGHLGYLRMTKNELLEFAWGIIANVSEGSWSKQPSYWQEAAERWREEYFAELHLDGSMPNNFLMIGDL